MRRLILTLSLLLLAAPAMAQRDGLYDVTGTNLDGTEYTGIAQIRAVGMNSFLIRWRTGNEVVDGMGMASGRTVAVTYGAAQRPGIGIYTINPDGSMDGEWTIVGAPTLGRERLVPRPAEAPPAAPPPAAPPAGPPATPPAASPNRP
ncbi:MAG TPA: hypothetical protein VGN83_07055 [Falsiroseomonas sp.]|jgi:hypothetical protein|nr:hypothetical protein [Falsiroseomonas sp.]